VSPTRFLPVDFISAPLISLSVQLPRGLLGCAAKSSTFMASLIPDSVVLIVIALWAYLYDVKGLCSRRPVLSALAHKLSNVRIWTRRHDPDASANEGSQPTRRVDNTANRERSSSIEPYHLFPPKTAADRENLVSND
jgi:hypothetical protein